jgi:hypothetical protein
MKPVGASDFTRNFGNYRMLAQRNAVPVSSHGSITGYFIHAGEYEDYLRFKAQRRSFATEELSDDKVQAIAATRMDPRHDGLNKLLDAEQQ